MRSWTTVSEDETRALGERLAAELAPAGLLLLLGDMGSGKTVLTQGIARGLGIDPAEVLSPTFVLAREHEGSGGSLLHIDLYRLDPDDTVALGLDELFAENAVKSVEWAERLPSLPQADLVLELSRGAEPATRRIREIALANLAERHRGSASG